MSRSNRGLLGGGLGIIVVGAVALYLISRWGQARKAAQAQAAMRALQGARLTF